jgi:hypothetical protein
LKRFIVSVLDNDNTPIIDEQAFYANDYWEVKKIIDKLLLDNGYNSLLCISIKEET